MAKAGPRKSKVSRLAEKEKAEQEERDKFYAIARQVEPLVVQSMVQWISSLDPSVLRGMEPEQRGFFMLRRSAEGVSQMVASLMLPLLKGVNVKGAIRV